MLMTSFAASVGGLATPVGTPPNVIGLGFIRALLGVEVPFFKWMLIGVPVVLVLFGFLASTSTRRRPAGVRELPGGAELHPARAGAAGPVDRGAALGRARLRRHGRALGRCRAWSRWPLGKRSAVYQALSRRMPEGVAALLGARLLFILPGDERRASDHLAGGGADRLGRRAALRRRLRAGRAVVPDRPGRGRGPGPHRPAAGARRASDCSWPRSCVAMLLSETTSNTASANMVVPVVIAIATGRRARPAGAGPRRDDGRQPRLHAAGLHARATPSSTAPATSR